MLARLPDRAIAFEVPLMRRRCLPLVAAVVLAALTSCSRKDPLLPGTHAIAGHVKLRGFHVDRSGGFTGTRIIGDADGLPVELLYGSQVLARTTTENGMYRFDGVRPGGYNVRVRIIPGIEWVTRNIAVVNRDVAVGDTLLPTSIGSMLPVPNPFADTLQVYVPVDDTTRAKLALLDGGAHPVRTFFDHTILPAMYRVDLVLPPIPAASAPAYYWMTYSADGDVRAQLLIREPAVTTPAAAGASPHSGNQSEAYPLAIFRVARQLLKEKALLVH